MEPRGAYRSREARSGRSIGLVRIRREEGCEEAGEGEACPCGRAPDPTISSPMKTLETTSRLAQRRASLSRSLFLLAAGLSFVASIALWFLVDREQGLFVGLWVPSILSLGAMLTRTEEVER